VLPHDLYEALWARVTAQFIGGAPPKRVFTLPSVADELLAAVSEALDCSAGVIKLSVRVHVASRTTLTRKDAAVPATPASQATSARPARKTLRGAAEQLLKLGVPQQWAVWAGLPAVPGQPVGAPQVPSGVAKTGVLEYLLNVHRVRGASLAALDRALGVPHRQVLDPVARVLWLARAHDLRLPV